MDPCCGAGEAPAEIATKIASLGYATTTYGIELNKERATAARRNLNEVLHCDFFHTTIAHDSMDMVWLNPPYDIQSPDQAYKRAEGAYLKRAIPYLKKATGLLVFIVPRKSLLDTASTISREFRTRPVRRISPPRGRQLRPNNPDGPAQGTARPLPDADPDPAVHRQPAGPS